MSPRHRRWRQTLRSLTLDPTALPRPLAEPGPRDFIIGVRTGTALLTAALYQPPAVVTVMEPWDTMRLPPAELFRSLRAELAAGILRRGRLDIDALLGPARSFWCSDGACPSEVATTDTTLLGVKFPAFWQYLDLLPNTKFLVSGARTCCYGPLLRAGRGAARTAVWTTGSLQPAPEPVAAGALRHRRCSPSRSVDTINLKVLEHADRANVHLVRYENWGADEAAQMHEISRFLADRPCI